MNTRNVPFTFTAVFGTLMCCVSCKKFLEVGPPETQLVASTVFTDDATAIAAANGIYGSMSQIDTYTISAFPGLSSDELIDYSFDINQHQFYTNALSTTNNNIESSLWAVPFQHIYQANALLEGLSASNLLSQAVIKQLTGEALFIRSFWYMYLVNMFGDVPWLTRTDYTVNRLAKRWPKSLVYSNLIQDLQRSLALLSEQYLDSRMAATHEHIRPNKWIAMSLLARARLYTGSWQKADSAASAVIGSGQFTIEPDLDRVFLKNSAESIWQLMPVASSYNTVEGHLFILSGRPASISLSPRLMDAFEENDRRKSLWTNYVIAENDTFYYPYKYKVKSSAAATAYREYSMVFRLAEQYLIRAEARAQQNNIQSSKEDLNIIRNRAGLPETTASSKEELLRAIRRERRAELFTEWGHRWFDLLRSHLADAVLAPIKANWQSADTLYPIPQSEIMRNPNLTQNKGY